MKKLFFTFCFFFLSFFNGASLSIQKNSYEGLIEESILNQSITPIPTGESIQSFCDSATVNDLIVNEDPGGIITWFDSATGGIPLDSTDPLVNGELVYAEQTLGGVTSVGRFQVIVHFISPNITANKTEICSGESVELNASLGAPVIPNTVFTGIFNLDFYYLSDFKANFFLAEQFANKYSGHLVSIHSTAEKSFLTRNLNVSFLIGLNDELVENDFVWTDGTPRDFNSWAGGEPNNQGNEDAVISKTNGQWNDYPSTLSAISVFQINSGVTYSWSTGEVSESIIVSPTATSDFWVDITINGVTCRKTIEIPLANPDSPISGGDETSCEITSLRTSATVGVGETLTWYDASVGGNIITNPILDTVGTITYYAESNNDVSGCISLERTPVTLTMNTLPLAPFNTFDITVQEQLTAQTITANAEVNIGETLIWYDASIGGDVVTDPSLSSVGVITYYAESVVDATGCISQSRTPVTLTILDAPDPPTAAPIQSFCDIPGSKIADLSPNGPSVQWYDAPFNGNVLDPASFLVNSQLVYASQTVNGIESLTRTQVMAHLTATYLATADTDLCLGDSVELQAGWGYIEIPNTLRVGRFDDAFAFRSTMAMNYTDAQNFAQSFGGNLASVRSQPLYEDYFSPHVEIAEEIHWFGLNDLSTEGTFSFSDGTPVTYTNWSPGQGGLSPDEDGVYFGLDGTWSDADITETHKFLFQLRNIGPSFLWSTGETTEYITVTPTVTAAYWLDVTLNGNTCRFDFSVTVNDPPTPGITNNTGATELTCDETSISLTATGGVTYSWSDGITTVSSIADLNITTPGTYTVTVTGANGCSDSTDIVISQNTTLPTPGITNNTGATELTCDETSISLIATGGVTYSWSDGITTVSSIAELNITTPGTYTVTVTGANGCSDTTDIVISQNTTLPTPGITNNTGATELTCDETSISLAATGGVTYSWSDGITTVSSIADLNITTPGTYTVTVTGANGCSDTTDIVITQNTTLPTPGITNNTGATELTCDETSISLAATGGVTYSWSDGITTVSSIADLNVTTPGTYTVTVTGANGCSDTNDIVITQDTILPTPGITNNTGAIELTCALTSIGLTATGGVSYSWSDGITTVSSIADLNITTPGTYTVTVTGANGCSDTNGIVITQDITLIPGITNNTGATELTCDETSISLSATGGVTYSWSDGITTVSSIADLNITTPGTYTVTVTGANGCSDTTDIVITQNTILPTPGITNNTGATELTCDETSISLTATGGVTYSWSDGITTVSSIADLNVTTPGTYTVTVTGANGCSDITDVVITQNTTLPTPGITNNTGATELTCDETSISLTATGGVTYGWSDGITTVSSIADLNITTPGTYTVTVTGANGCSAATDIVITQNTTLPTPGITNNTGATELTCALTSIGLTATGGVSYSWSDGITTVSSIADLNVTTPGTYSVTVTGPNGCSDTTDIVITQDITLIPGITNNTGATELTCDETSISLSATGGVTYSWSDGITTVSSIADLNITTPGTYTVTVTGANGCSDTTDIVITQNTTLPTPGITNNTGATELTCDETSISLTATGGVTYSWSDGIITVSSIATLNVTTPGTYTVTVTGANGCSDTESRTITDDIALPTAGIMNNTLSTELTCSLTSINITATGGGTYVWNTGDTTPDLNIIVPGIYTVKVTSSNGCTDTESIIITEDIGPNSPISEGDQIGCEFTILTASAKVFPGEIITWYDAAIGGNIVADPFLNSVGSVTYYAEAINVITNCSSLIRTAVTLSIVSEPDAPMGDGIQVFCDIPTIGDLLVVGDDIRWYDSAIDGNQLNATLQLTNGQTVYASQTISGCESNDRISVNVVFDLKITPMFTQVDPICFGDTLLTLPTISINGYKGVWSPILDNTVTTTYTFTPDIGQCATNSTMTIEVYPRPQTPNGMAEQYFCAINSPMISDLILNTSFLNWYLTPNGGQSLSQNYLLTDGLNLFASSYDALNFCESSSRFKVEISVENPLLPDLETEISFCKELNPIIDFVNTNGVTMNWYDSSVGGELLTSEYILENGETLYAATFNTASGCESIDRLEFNIEIIDSDLEYYNAITIDSNNINDALRIIGIENFPLNTIEIYNRYGTLVWKNSNYNNKTVVFNGKANVSGVVSKDSFLPSGTYFFVLKYPNYCKQTQLKGFINIDNKN